MGNLGYETLSGLGNSQKDHSCDILLNFPVKFREKLVVFTAGDFNEHSGVSENYVDQHGGSGFRVKDKKVKTILEFCETMNVTVGNTLF